MAKGFTRCVSCGIIFPQIGSETECEKCASDSPDSKKSKHQSKEELRRVKNAIRDAMAKGVFLTVQELGDQTEVEVSRIWNFIHNGELDTASFDDPKVREFLVKKRREQEQARGGGGKQKKQEEKKYSGFRGAKKDDDRRR